MRKLLDATQIIENKSAKLERRFALRVSQEINTLQKALIFYRYLFPKKFVNEKIVPKVILKLQNFYEL